MDGQDERDATAAAQEAVEAVAQTARLDPADLMTRALVAAALAPSINLMPQMTMQTDGSQVYQTVPVKGPSPLAEIGKALWEDRRAEVIAAVVERVTPESIAEAIAEHVTRELTQPRARNSWDRLHPDAEAVQKLVREQLASTLSARAMQTYDDEQAEMRAALAEKRAREQAEQA